MEKELGELEIGRWTNPNGGYFVSFNSLDGCAKKIVSMCKEAGVTLTGAGIGDCDKWIEFTEGMLEKLFDSQITPYTNRDGKIFAGLKRINGKLIYFKFTFYKNNCQYKKQTAQT